MIYSLFEILIYGQEEKLKKMHHQKFISQNINRVILELLSGSI